MHGQVNEEKENKQKRIIEERERGRDGGGGIVGQKNTNKQTKSKTSKTEEMTESRTNKYNNKKKQYNRNGSYQCDNIT